MTVAIAQWNLSQFFAVLLRDVGASTAWIKFHHLGPTVVVPALLVLVLEYAGRDDLVTRRTIGLLLVEPIVHNVLIWTNAAHGLSIPEAERDQVFESGHTQRENGTGLGLAICQSIVEAHGWNISVTESATGNARFEITGVERSADRPA